MTRILVLALVACGGPGDPVHAAPTPPSHDLPPRQRAAAQLVALAMLPDLDSASVARVLETTQHGGSCEQYRCDSTLAATDLFEDIQISSGARWCTVRLVPAASLALALQDLVPFVLDARYAGQPIVVHHQDGLEIAGVMQHFAFGKHEIAATIRSHPPGDTVRAGAANAVESSIDQVSVDTRRDAIQSVDVTCTSRVGANTWTLRAFRHWAATHP
jgi:hypothetical protein